MSTPDSSGVSGGSSDKSGPQITVQKSASIVQATAQQATTFRTITGGQPSQVRVVIPPPVTLMPHSMIKQIENSTGGVRTQITTIPAAARTMSQTSITVTRPVTPTTYIPRATGVTTTNIQAQRLTTPIRTPTPPTVTGISAATAGSFVRGATVAAATAAVARNSSSAATANTSISPATATWMATANGQVQLIRAINHQPRQRIIAQNISTTGGTGVVSVAQAAGQSQQQQQQNQTNLQTVQTSQQPQPQTFVATVMPPRQPTATLVYSNVSSTQPQQYNSTSTPTQRFAVAASLTGNQRQVRPIQLSNRTFSTAKLGVGGMNTTSISIRAPSIPVLAPTINTAGGATGTLQARTAGTTTGNVNLSTTSLSTTTRIIQLQQQQPGSGTQQIIGSTGRIASNLMLQPIIMNATAGGKIGIRPPSTIATKVQPSLTITQLGLGKISTAQQSAGTAASLTAASLQSASITPSSVSANTSSVVVSGATVASIAQQQSSQQQQTASITQQQQPTTISVNVSNTQQPITQIVSVSQNLNNSGNAPTGQIIATQNVPASATVVPLTITSRGTNVLTGTITSMKATGATVSSSISVPPIAKVIPQQQTQSLQQSTQNQQHHQPSQSSQIHSNQLQQQSGQQQVTEIITSSGHQPQQQQSSHHQPTSVFIHTRPPSSGSTGTATVIPTTGTFLPGGTFYYESVPANSVSVSTGVISLTTTTISTVSNSPSVTTSNSLSANATGIVTSIPYNSSSGTAGTFTVVPSNSRATIGQIQIPVSSSATSGGASQQTTNVSQIQAVPIRFTPQHLSNAAADHPTITVSQTPPQQTQSQQSQQQHQTLPHATTTQSQQQQQTQHHQIITMTQQQQSLVSQSQQQQTPQPPTHVQQTHMLIPIQTSIKIPAASATVATASPPRTTSTNLTGNIAASLGTTATAFFRKRDNDGSPIRATKSLAPTIISMGTAAATSNSGSQIVAIAAATTNQQTTSTTTIIGTATGILAERNKESNERPVSPHSRPSSSGSTTVSANSSPGVDQQEEMNSMLPINIRSESHFNPINDMYANHQNPVASSISLSQPQPQQQIINISSSTNGNIEVTPRKKPRKQVIETQQIQQQNQTTIIINQQQHQQHQQQFNNNLQNVITPTIQQQQQQQHQQTNNSSAVSGIPPINNNASVSNNTNNNNNNAANHDVKANNTAVNNKENTKPTEYIIKKPRTCSLLDGYRQNWKAANNHFQRYSDVKPREERRPTVMDLANQANVVQKINGWKIYHLSAQMEDLCEIELQVYSKLESMLKQLESHEQSQDLDRVNELVKGNMQRSKIIVDGVNEARTQIMKIFDHKSHVSDIIHRCASKRNFKKREKT